MKRPDLAEQVEASAAGAEISLASHPLGFYLEDGTPLTAELLALEHGRVTAWALNDRARRDALATLAAQKGLSPDMRAELRAIEDRAPNLHLLARVLGDLARLGLRRIPLIGYRGGA